VKVPTLIVQHTGFTQNIDSARQMAALIPNARMVLLDGMVTDENNRIVRGIAELMGTHAALSDRQLGATALNIVPSGVRTILFTDLVSHTSMMARLGDERGRDILREHERITRETLRAHGGTEVKTMGDGFMASFPSPSGAVDCAIALQRAFDEWNQGVHATLDQSDGHDDHGHLDVRVGLNAGEPIEEGGDLFGATVIMASRIANHAAGGEILASDVVRALCAGKSFLFADRGENVLRGFEDPVHVYEVRWRE
jgi:class 3 adenylate cyclase